MKRRRVEIGSTPTKKDLVDQIETEGEQYFEKGNSDNRWDAFFSLTAIGGSLAATILSAISVRTEFRWLAAAVAAVPAACASVQKVVDFKGRANWNYRSAAGVRALALELTYQDNADLNAFARRRGAFEIAMEREWANIGSSTLDRETIKSIKALQGDIPARTRDDY